MPDLIHKLASVLEKHRYTALGIALALGVVILAGCVPGFKAESPVTGLPATAGQLEAEAEAWVIALRAEQLDDEADAAANVAKIMSDLDRRTAERNSRLESMGVKFNASLDVIEQKQAFAAGVIDFIRRASELASPQVAGVLSLGLVGVSLGLGADVLRKNGVIRKLKGAGPSPG